MLNIVLSLYFLGCAFFMILRAASMPPTPNAMARAMTMPPKMIENAATNDIRSDLELFQGHGEDQDDQQHPDSLGQQFGVMIALFTSVMSTVLLMKPAAT